MAADLDLPVAIVACPTVRDADGLALSSRNARLLGRASASARSRCPARCARSPPRSRPGELRDGAAISRGRARALRAGGAEPEYFTAVDPRDARPGARASRATCCSLTAARVGDVRLIDNLTARAPAATLPLLHHRCPGGDRGWRRRPRRPRRI